jgi:hypothetical protein
MTTMGNDSEGRLNDHLWAEAMWGVGLIATVLGFVVLLVSVFGY